MACRKGICESLESTPQSIEDKGLPLLENEKFDSLRDHLNGNIHFRSSQKDKKHDSKFFTEPAPTYWTDMNAELMDAILTDRSVTVISKLINCGASCNTTSVASGISALHLAASKGNIEVIKLLLTEGADPNSIDVFGRSPLHIAAQLNQVAVLNFLIKGGCQVNHGPGSPVKNGEQHYLKVDPRSHCLKTITIKVSLFKFYCKQNEWNISESILQF